MPLLTTLIASAVDSVPVGDFSFDLPSSVLPSRSSRNTVTMRRISARAGGSAGRSSARPIDSTRICTIETSSSSVAGVGSTTVLKRRFSALDISLTPRSLLLAVAIMRQFGSDFREAVATVVYFVAWLIPWLFVILPGLVLLRMFWRRVGRWLGRFERGGQAVADSGRST